MPNQHSAAKTPVTFRIRGEILNAAKERARSDGDNMTAVVERLLARYGGIKMPPADEPEPQPS